MTIQVISNRTTDPDDATAWDTPNEAFDKVNDNFALLLLHSNSVLDYIDEAKHAAILSTVAPLDVTAEIVTALATTAAGTRGSALYFPRGDYVIGEQTGSGRAVVSLLIASNVHLIGAPGARLVIKDGSTSRPLLIRDADNVVIQGLEIVYDKDDGSATSGLVIENSSNVRVEGNIIDGFTFFGIAVNEDTSAAVYAASTFAFDNATSRINDSASGFTLGATGFRDGDIISVVGSLSNNGVYTLSDAAAGYLEVTGSLTNEAAGASGLAVISEEISFSPSVNTIEGPADFFNAFRADTRVTVAGSVSNDGDYTILDVSPSGDRISVDGDLVLEEIGAAVTITKIGRPTISVIRAEACDNIRILNNLIQNCESNGITTFPKARSHTLLVDGNIVYNCGWLGSVPAIKAGQGHVNAQVTNNLVAHCVHGIGAVNWESLTVANNSIVNCYAYGIAITHSEHPKYVAGFSSLAVRNNHICYERDYISDVAFDPSATNTIDEARRIFSQRYGAINVNGLRTARGVIDIHENQVKGWGQGLTIDKSYVGMPDIRWRDNTVIDSGGSYVAVLEGTGDLEVDSNTVSNVTVDGAETTAGWYVDSVIQHALLPEGTTVIAVDSALRTLTLSATASDTAVGALLESGYPAGMTVSGNTWEDTQGSGTTAVVKIYSSKGLIEKNLFVGLAAYALQVRGDKTTIRDNTFRRINEEAIANRAPILINGAGTYYVTENFLDLASGGSAARFLFGSQGGVNATVYSSDNRSTDAAVIPQVDLTPLAMSVIHGDRTIDWATFGKTIGAELHASASVAVATGTLHSTITFDTERLDTDGMVDIATQPTRITCVTPGTYVINGNIRFDTNAVGDRSIRIKHTRGAVATNIAVQQGAALSAGSMDLAVSRSYALLAGDYLELQCYQTSGGNLSLVTTDYSPVFSAHRI